MKKNRFINKVILLLSIAFTFLITSSTAQPLIVGQINPRSLNVPCGYTGYPLVLTFQNTYAYINNFLPSKFIKEELMAYPASVH